MVEYIRSDLEAILFHIKIAEAHAAGQPLYGPDPDGAEPLLGGLIPTYNLAWGLRTVDGSQNNLLPGREYWGASNQPFTTHMDPTYRTVMVDPDGPGPSGPVPMSYTPTLIDPDGPGRAVAGDVLDPALRTISNLIVDQTLANPAAIVESLRRTGIAGDLLTIALGIKNAHDVHKAAVKAAAAAQVVETAKLAVLATETGEQAVAASTAANAASALTTANATLAQDILDLAAATSASQAADAAVVVAQSAYTAAQAALIVAQSAYNSALALAGTSASALAAATTALNAATNARDTAAAVATTALATAGSMQGLEETAAANLVTALGVQTNAQADVTAAQTALVDATSAVTAAQGALAIATADSVAADAALVLAQGNEVAAQGVLDAAQAAYDAAVLANAPTAAALAVAAAALAAAIAAHEAEVTAETTAALAAAQAAHDAAVIDNQPTADALAAATSDLATATSGRNAAVAVVGSATAFAEAKQADEDAATVDLATAQGNQTTAQATFDAAQAALVIATDGVTAAQGALVTATANSDAADAALALAQGNQATAQTALNGAQSVYDAAFAASGPADAALAAAATDLVNANAAQGNTQAALTAANVDAVDAQTLEDAAVADLAASQAAQATADGANTAAQAALATANAELAAAQLAATNATAASNASDLAASTASTALDGLVLANGIELSGENIILPAVATDEGLSAPFNSWFTLFGQFFDHGLDLVNKGGSGTVFVPLAQDDPLYDPGPDGIAGNADDSRTNFMVLTRATTAPGTDGVFGTADDIRPLNTTTSFVDQNQTYSSHPSHQVFLREYELTASGPEATGRLIEGVNGGMANWGELKQYASTILGIQLLDSDVGKVPLLRTDQYGNFIPGANGFPQVITGIGLDGIPNTADDDVIEGDPTANDGKGVSVVAAIRTTSMFLADIAHNAAPNGSADGDSALGLNNLGASTAGTYDNELLDKHFIAGDGRVNENIGLITVHHIFHAEHNRMVEHTKEVVLASADPAFIAEWLVPGANQGDGIQAHEWNGERLFQAAKFGTEMQYQHLVFEEFARKVQPTINVFLVPDGYDADINPSIMAEFAHVVYRFGHSMLTETVDRFDSNFQADHIGLIEAFLNPVEFDSNGTVLDGIAAGEIVRGMTRQVGNHIDEFVTTALRNNLLGLPLDLATINLARGRDTGVPSLNAARRDFYDATNNLALKPYESWSDFAANLKNETSIINFIAAYGTHTLITGQTTIEGKRDAALTIITGSSFGDLDVPPDAEAFLNATGLYAGGSLGGLENVDLWIGGLAERTMPFGGMLGSTFNFVFEVQMESLQNGDRFYYLGRNTGQHLFEQLEANSLASMIGKHTDAKHLPADVFSTPAFTLEVDRSKQYNDLDGDGTLEHDEDPQGPSLLSPLVVRNNPATVGPDANYLQYKGDEHVVLGGTAGNDTLIAGIGDDTLHGDAGNDRLEGNFGNDVLLGGDGDDIMTDQGGDDVFKGGKGNDVMSGGSGIDLFLPGAGNDFVVHGTDDGSETFAGLGNDFVLSSPTSEPVIGNEGDDWIENGGNVGLVGDNNDDGLFRDGIRGNDVFVGVGGLFDEYRAEGGDDIMVGSLGSAKQAGMSGFDWVTYKNLTIGLDASLLDGFIFDEAPIDPGGFAFQRFESVEGLSGTRFNDRLTGSNLTAADRLAGLPEAGFQGSALDAQGIALINGLQALLGAGVTSYSAGDILLGGDGNDEFVGGGGDDYIDGDKWLNVRISIRANTDGTGPEIGSADSMTELTARMFSGQINPGQLVIVREILTADGEGDIDTAIYSGTLADYAIEGRTVDGVGGQLTRARDVNGDGYISVTDNRDIDGIDLVKNVEMLRFADQSLSLAVNRAPLLDLHAFDLVTTVSSQYRDDFTNAVFNNSNGTTAWNTSWVETGDDNGVTTGQIQTDGGNGNSLRLVTGDGASITRAVDLGTGGVTTLSFNYAYAGIDAGDTLRVEFAANGTDFVTLDTITGVNNAILGAASFSRDVAGTSTSAVRFTVSALAAGEVFRLDDLILLTGNSVVVPVADGTGFTSTFTEDNLAVPIALNASITDTDSPTIVSAQIRLTNAQSLDVLSINGALPAGITSSFGPLVAGEVTLNLSGSASRAAYQAAIGAVRFQNDSLNPNTTPRIIEVTVGDGDNSSLVAIATVNVVSVNDVPVVGADAIVTNVTSGNIVIPEWVLLTNDSDEDGPLPLDITAVSAAVGVTGLSLVTTPGSVTLVDDGAPAGSFTYTANDGGVGGTANGAVTVTNVGYTTVADNFNGAGAVLSAANNSTGTTSWAANSWTEANDDANIRTGQIQIDVGVAPSANTMRFGIGDGASISRAVNLAGVTAATLSLSFDKTGIDANESVQVQFAADGVTFTTLSTITSGGANGGVNANGTLSLALTGALGANSAIRFVGSGINEAAESILLDNVVIAYGGLNAAVTAAAGNQILVGSEVGSSFSGGAGNDIVLANGGDDTINWSVGHGRDFIDGGANGVPGDEFIVTGDNTVEAYVVYARANAIAAGVVVQNALTEIVVTRNGVVVAELDNIEEITINTLGGVDSTAAIGDFNGTSLLFNTITVNGGTGRDSIDASQLTSAHKLVLNPGDAAAAQSATSAAFVEFESIGRSGMNGLVRKGLIDDSADLGFGASRYQGWKHNPNYERKLAVDDLSFDFGRGSQIEHSALHFDAADYLIN